MKTIDIKSATTAELLAFYNANSGKDPVKRFSDRKSAERRVSDLLAAIPTPVQNDTPRRKAEQGSASRSEAIVASWGNKTVAAARATRNGCVVTTPTGEKREFKSVRVAFMELGLPIGRHIRFRGQLKQAGQNELNGYKFKLN